MMTNKNEETIVRLKFTAKVFLVFDRRKFQDVCRMMSICLIYLIVDDFWLRIESIYCRRSNNQKQWGAFWIFQCHLPPIVLQKTEQSKTFMSMEKRWWTKGKFLLTWKTKPFAFMFQNGALNKRYSIISPDDTLRLAPATLISVKK